MRCALFMEQRKLLISKCFDLKVKYKMVCKMLLTVPLAGYCCYTVCLMVTRAACRTSEESETGLGTECVTLCTATAVASQPASQPSVSGERREGDCDVT